MKSLIAAAGLTFFKITFMPSYNLLAWVVVAILLDFITGVWKAAAQGADRTSFGYRKTVGKIGQYVGAVAAAVILGNTVPKDNLVVQYMNDGLLILLIFIEVTSIFENLYAINSKSMFARYFIAPILKVLTFSIKKNPLNQTHGDDKN